MYPASWNQGVTGVHIHILHVHTHAPLNEAQNSNFTGGELGRVHRVSRKMEEGFQARAGS